MHTYCTTFFEQNHALTPWKSITKPRTDSYRYGFNGKEKDDEVSGSTGVTYDYGFRIYDARIARFLSVDPLTNKYPYKSPYDYAENTPIQAIDQDGLEKFLMAGSLSVWGYDNVNKKYIKYDSPKFQSIKPSSIEWNIAKEVTKAFNLPPDGAGYLLYKEGVITYDYFFNYKPGESIQHVQINVTEFQENTKRLTEQIVDATVGAVEALVLHYSMTMPEVIPPEKSNFEEAPITIETAENSSNLSPNLQKVFDWIDDFKKEGGSVVPNKLKEEEKQEINYSFIQKDKSRLNLRVETHSLEKDGVPVKHLNAEVKTKGGNKVKMPHIKDGHKTLE